MKYIITLFFISSALLAQNSPVYSKNGLEVDNLNYIDVVVEYLSEDAKKLGLNREDLDALVRMSLRSNGIKPTNDDSASPYLYININVLKSSVNISIEYFRLVFYYLGDRTYYKTASTWIDGSTGLHGNSGVFITDNLRRLIDKFCIAYYKANE